jgi:hypothetical protein
MFRVLSISLKVDITIVRQVTPGHRPVELRHINCCDLYRNCTTLDRLSGLCGLAEILLIGSYYISWSFAVLPFWAFLVSIYILIDNLGRRQKTD